MSDWEVIDVYTREMALEDGVIVNLGKIRDIYVDATVELASKGLLLAKAVVRAVDLMSKRKLKEYNFVEIENEKILITASFDEKGNKVITLMFPWER